jgi:hypothetical protein
LKIILDGVGVYGVFASRSPLQKSNSTARKVVLKTAFRLQEKHLFVKPTLLNNFPLGPKEI